MGPNRNSMTSFHSDFLRFLSDNRKEMLGDSDEETQLELDTDDSSNSDDQISARYGIFVL